jgi:hypothetical protein
VIVGTPLPNRTGIATAIVLVLAASSAPQAQAG